uniref:Tr-type G domain-containing protein n=1 Tax=Palpitomonas bilix TaxID=652834 RepID=A0A7S3DEN1_9EUKA|mmetsp:Transcript_34328/g.88745  ORF Transcript_34328/g.88745 Transcript_34328/m.88745 type:complete len:409 (+) Transcript_34328:94-1320(+)
MAQEWEEPVEGEEVEELRVGKTVSCEMVGLAEALQQEVEEGNCEYKWKLCDPTPERLDKLVSQLKWRIEEGLGEAVYEIGFEDDGTPRGLSDEEMEKSLDTLKHMAAKLDSHVTVVRTSMGKEGKCAEVLVRHIADMRHFMELRIAVIGNVDAGKSTLIGVLTKGKLDNGRGSARMNVFRYRHEAENGRTSAISLQIMGLDAKGDVVNYSSLRDPSWSEIAEKSSKILTFVDLAGHEKYIKTTMFGMTAHVPDYAMVMVGGNMGVTKMTKEHLGLALALKIPFYIVITKIDIAPEHVLKRTIDTLTKILRSPGVRKMPMICKCEEDAVTVARSIGNSDGRVVPIFLTSCVKGDGLDHVRSFLNLLPARQSTLMVLTNRWKKLAKISRLSSLLMMSTWWLVWVQLLLVP